MRGMGYSRAFQPHDMIKVAFTTLETGKIKLKKLNATAFIDSEHVRKTSHDRSRVLIRSFGSGPLNLLNILSILRCDDP